VNIGFVGVSLAFGLTVVTVHTARHISGGHFNPAVTIGAVIDRGRPRAALRTSACSWSVRLPRPDCSRDRERSTRVHLKASGFAANGFATTPPDIRLAGRVSHRDRAHRDLRDRDSRRDVEARSEGLATARDRLTLTLITTSSRSR
jgi:hypothetical protein